MLCRRYPHNVTALRNKAAFHYNSIRGNKISHASVPQRKNNPSRKRIDCSDQNYNYPSCQRKYRQKKIVSQTVQSRHNNQQDHTENIKRFSVCIVFFHFLKSPPNKVKRKYKNGNMHFLFTCKNRIVVETVNKTVSAHKPNIFFQHKKYAAFPF